MEVERIAGIAARLKKAMDGLRQRVSQSQSGSASEERQEPALDQMLPEEPRAAGSQRQTHGGFTLPADRARQQQVRHVGADDQQQDADQQHQDPERSGILRAQPLEATAARQG